MEKKYSKKKSAETAPSTKPQIFSNVHLKLKVILGNKLMI